MATLIQTNNAEPSTPSSGSTVIYVDSSTKKLSTKDDAGLVTDYTPGAGGADELVKTSAADTTAGYLEDKIVAGSGITLTKQNTGSNENILIEAASSAIDPNVEIDYTEFLLRGPNASGQGYSAWATFAIGTGVDVSGADALDDNIPENYFCGWKFDCGTSAGARVGAYASSTSTGKGSTYFGGNGVYRKDYYYKAPPNVGDGLGDDIEVYIGWSDGGNTTSEPTSFCCVYYNSAVSDKIQLGVKNNSGLSITKTPSDVTLTANQIYQFSIIVYDDAGTLTAELYIDGVLKVTITTNVPNSQAAAMGDYFRAKRSSATATSYKMLLLSHIRTRVTYPAGRF